MLMTRGALTTFSIANDVAKYFAIIPAAFATTYPALAALNVMHLATRTARSSRRSSSMRWSSSRSFPWRSRASASGRSAGRGRRAATQPLICGVAVF